MSRRPLDWAKNAIAPPPHNFQKKLPTAVATPLKKNLCHASSPSAIAVDDVERLIADYLLDCDYRLMSPNTLDTRRCFYRNFVWFLRHREYAVCDTPELRQFLHYLRHGHEEPGGRWGNPNYKKTVRPATIRDYYVALRCFFNWLVTEGELGASPLDAIPKPPLPTEQVQPFSNEQIQALLKAARRSTQPRRNEAIVLFLYDTGVRATELCQLTMADIDMENRHARVLGKGNKSRTVYFSRETARVEVIALAKNELQQENNRRQQATNQIQQALQVLEQERKRGITQLDAEKKPLIQAALQKRKSAKQQWQETTKNGNEGGGWRIPCGCLTWFALAAGIGIFRDMIGAMPTYSGIGILAMLALVFGWVVAFPLAGIGLKTIIRIYADTIQAPKLAEAQQQIEQAENDYQRRMGGIKHEFENDRKIFQGQLTAAQEHEDRTRTALQLLADA